MDRASQDPPILDEAHAAFIQGGCSIIVSGRDCRNVPTLVEGLGCRVSPDRTTVTVFVAASRGAAFLEDVRANRAIAMVVSQPSTHRTIQLKGTDACIEALAADDLERIESRTARYAAEIAGFGWPEEFLRAMLWCRFEDVVAVRFTPSAAFIQTPGPQAGSPLGGG